MRRVIPAHFLIVILFSTAATGNADPPDSLSVDPDQLQTTLPNGMQVFIQDLPDAKLARVGVFFSAGSASDPDSLAGLAHFSEHLLTESSLNYPEGELIRQVTLHSTYRNAYTGPAFMQFDTECLPVFLPRVLELEADRFRGMEMDAAGFAREKGIVLAEIAMRKRLPPVAEFQETLFRACFPGHPFGREVGGTPTTLGRIRMEDFLAFGADHIRPEKAALVVKGPLDPDSTLTIIEKHFGFGPEASPEHPPTPPYPPAAATQVVFDSHDHSGLILGLAFRIPLRDEIDGAFTAVLPYFMAESRLHPVVYPVPGEAVVILTSRSAYSRPSSNPEDHWATIYPDFDPEQQSLRYMGYLWDDISTMVDDVRGAGEFDKRLARALDGLDNSSVGPGTSQGLGVSLVNGNRHLSADMVREILDGTGPGDFLDFMARWINTDRVAVGVSHGKDSERPATLNMTRPATEAPDRGAASALDKLTREEIDPVLAVYRKSKTIELDRYFLFNGTPVYTLDVPGTDQLAVAGYRTLPGIKDMRPGKMPGVTRIYDQVVNYDDKQRSDPDRNIPPRRLPFHVDFHLDWNHAELSASGARKKAAKIIAALDTRVTSRDFNNARWYSVTRWGEGYLQSFVDVRTNAARAWRWEQFVGRDHPAIGKWAPEPDSFRKIKYKDLSDLHKDGFQKTGNLALLVAADEPGTGIQGLLNETFGEHEKWKAPKPETLPRTDFDGIRGKVFPDLTRGDVALDLTFAPAGMRPGPGPVATVLVLEAAVDHVLTERLREKEGLTYSVWAGIHPLSGGLLWEISVTCQPGRTAETYDLLREELGRLAATGFTGDEIARARLQLLGRTIRNLSDQGSGLNQLTRYLELGEIPLDPLREISLVTAEGVNTLFRDYLDPARLAFTATGPLFEEDIEAFDIP